MQGLPHNAVSTERRRRFRSLLLQPLGFLGLRLLLLLLRCTILRVNHLYGTFVGYCLWCFNTNTKRVSRINLEISYPDLSTKERDQLLKQSLIEFGKTITDVAQTWTVNDCFIRALVTEISGQRHIDEALAARRGVIVLAPHLGSWELLGLYLSLEYGITSMYRPLKMQSADRFARRTRERFGANLVPTDLTGVRALRRALAQNLMTGILPDQDPGESGSCYAPFFGRAAQTMLLPSRLAAKSGCAIIYSFAERLPRGAGFRIHFIPADPEIISADDRIAAAALNRGVESLVRLSPSQYQWSYKRFKSPPAGESTPYQMPERRAA